MTLATSNGSKTVSQLLNEAYATLKAYKPVNDNATHFKIEHISLPEGSGSVVQRVQCYNHDILSTYTDNTCDIGMNTARAAGITTVAARLQTSGSMYLKSRTNTNGTITYTDSSNNTVDNNVSSIALLTLYKLI